jgi:hypothetical protein
VLKQDTPGGGISTADSVVKLAATVEDRISSTVAISSRI